MANTRTKYSEFQLEYAYVHCAFQLELSYVHAGAAKECGAVYGRDRKGCYLVLVFAMNPRIHSGTLSFRNRPLWTVKVFS
jgi:hypothetical protein